MKTETKEEESHSEQQAQAQLESIIEMVRAMDKETAAEDYVGGLSKKACLKLLLADGFTASDKATLKDLRDLVKDGMCDKFGSISPDDFEFDEDEARQAIMDDALSVELRSGWTSPGCEMEAAEFCILLCTGGPAVRIIGDLDEHGEPESCRIQHQDWGTSWQEFFLNSDQREIVLTYCRQFYFGD